MSDEARKSEPVFLHLSPVTVTSSASAHVTTPVQLRASAASRSSASATLSTVPLVHVASASVYPTDDGAQVVITRRPKSAVPKVDVSLNENIWDLTTVGFGIGAGAVIGHGIGAAVGGVALYVWGRWRWRQTHAPDS